MTPATSLPTSTSSTSGHETGTGLTKKRETGSRATWEKTDRLLLEGRLRVLTVDGNEIAAECRGDSGGIYVLGHHSGRWACSCPARTDCSHLRALWRVVAVER